MAFGPPIPQGCVLVLIGPFHAFSHAHHVVNWGPISELSLSFHQCFETVTTYSRAPLTGPGAGDSVRLKGAVVAVTL